MNYAAIQTTIDSNESNNRRLGGRQDISIKNALLAVLSYYTIPLKEVANSFFEPTTLREVLDAEIDIIERKGNIKSNAKQPRFHLTFGNHYGLIDCKLKGSDLHEIKFPNNVVTFIANSFEKPDEEKKSITDAINNNSNRCFLIIDRKTKKQKSNNKDEQLHCYKDEVVAAAICQFQLSGCYLLWFAATINKKKFKEPPVQQKGYGTLLLAVLQTCQEIIHANNYSIICQANITASVGFYLQNHFEIISPKNVKKYNEYKKSLQKMGAWLDYIDLRLLKSRAKVNVLHTWMYENIVDAEAFNEYIIPQLANVYFPNITTLGHRNNVEIRNLNNIIHGIDDQAKIESFEWISVLEKDEQDDTNSILYASNATLEQLLAVDNITNQTIETMPELLPSHDNHDHTENLFCIMSEILYNNSDHDHDIRCILAFIYNCFSVLSDEHPFLKHNTLTSKTIASENLQSFNVAKDLFERLQDEYDFDKLKDFLGITDKIKIRQPKILKKAFKLLKCHIISYGKPTNVIVVKKEKDKKAHVTFRGYPMDIVMFSNLIYPRIFLLSAQTHQSQDANYNQRLWQAHLRHIPKLKCITYENETMNRDHDDDIIYLIGHSHNNQFQLFRTKERNPPYNANDIDLKQIYRAKLYKENDPAIVYKKINEWLQDPKGKYFQNRENMYTLDNFVKGQIMMWNYLPIVRMIDPPKRIVNFFREKHFSFTSRLNINDFLSFQTHAWLQDSVLDDFYRSLQSHDGAGSQKNYLIGPEIVQTFKNMKNEQDENFKKIKNAITDKDLICIHINTGGHFITVEVNYTEALQNNYWNVIMADSLGVGDVRMQMNTKHLEGLGVIKFLKLLIPSSEVKVGPALHNTLQDNGYDCGVHGARRFYSLWKYNEVFPPTECATKIMDIIPFRLFMLQCILEASVNVSCYVSPTGFGNTRLIPLQNDNKNTEPTTPVVGRVTRNGPIKRQAIMPIPEGQEIIDVDATPDDNDENAKKIEANYEANMQVNLNFDKYLLFVDAHVIEEADGDPMLLDPAVNNDDNDVKTHESLLKDIVTKESTVEILSTPQKESIFKGPDDLMLLDTAVNNDNNDVKTDASFLKDIILKESTVEIVSTPQKESTLKEADTPQNLSFQYTSNDEGSVSEATLSESDHDINPKKSYNAKVARLRTTQENDSENESTDTESKQSSIKSKQVVDTDTKSKVASIKSKQVVDTKQQIVRSSPRQKKNTNQPAKKFTIKRNKNSMPSKKPKTQQERVGRATTKLRPNNRGIASKPPDRFGNTSGKTLAETIRNTRNVAIIANQAIQMANNWDITKIKKPITRNPRDFLREMDEPTTEMQELLIDNRIKEANAERVKNGRNVLTAEEENNWQQHYYDASQLEHETILESIQNEVSEDLQKAITMEAKTLKIYQDAKKQHGANDKTTTKKYDRYLKAKVEVTMLQFELDRSPVFHPYNSIYSIRIDDNNVDEESTWQYYVVYRASDNQFYEAPVAKGWLTDNLDPMYIKDLKRHCKARRYILYDHFGSKLTKNFQPYIRFSETDSLTPIYTYKPKEDDVKILRVKALASFVKSSKSKEPILNGRISWSIYVIDRDLVGSRTAGYIPINNLQMSDIIDRPLMEKWQQEMHKWFNDDLKALKLDPSSRVYPISDKKKRFIDLMDSKNYFSTQLDLEGKTEICTVSPYGNFDVEQPYYWETIELNLHINKTKTQIGGIRYCNKRSMFFGIENDPISKKAAHVPLKDSWVEENFDHQVIERIRTYANHTIESGKLYFKVPIGSARAETNICSKWNHNPPINFRQNGEETCSFKSLSSALSHLKFNVEATLIDNICNEFYKSSKFVDNFHRILQEIMDCIRKTDGLKIFRRQYTIKKLRSLHDIINFKCKKDDIRLVILHADDKSMNHAVSVVDGLIFDSNCANAMNLSFEALTEACNGSNYISIYQGYLFEKNI